MNPNFLPMSSYSLFNNGELFQPDFSWKVTGIADLLRRREDCPEKKSSTFAWPAHPHVLSRVKLNIVSDAAYISLDVSTLPHPEGRRHPIIRPIPTIWYKMIDRNSPGFVRQHVVRSRHTHFGASFSCTMTFEGKPFPTAWLASPIYNVNDSVIIEVYVEPPHMVDLVHNDKGILNWTIDRWSWKKAALLNGWIDIDESPYILTDDTGFRLQAWISPKESDDAGASAAGRGGGGGEEEGIAVRIVYLSGANDNDLPTGCMHQVCSTLMTPDRKRKSETVEDIIDPRGVYNVVIHRAGFDGMVENDSFIIQFLVM